MQENNASSTKDLLAVLNQVATMEKQLDAAVKELAAMRQELKTAQEQNHPVKHALQKTVIVMQGQVLDLSFLISPLGLPNIADWLIDKVDALNYSLRDFIMS